MIEVCVVWFGLHVIGTDIRFASLQLVDDKFDLLVHSPLARAAQTAEIIWGNRKGPTNVLPSLREIDLYSFQVCLPTCQTASAVSVFSLRADSWL